MTKHYLMVKTHNKTGLKYLCKKSTSNKQTCFTYKGSGTYWKKHLNIHGCDISTVIIGEYANNLDLKTAGIFWSKKFNVVMSESWANLVIEQGDGGPTMLGKKLSKTGCDKKSVSLTSFHKNTSKEYKAARRELNSFSHSIKGKTVYITPHGEFISCTQAQPINNLCAGSIKQHCIDGFNNKIIDSRRMGKLLFMKKTWREIGYNMRPFTELEILKYNNDLKNMSDKFYQQFTAKHANTYPRAINATVD